MGLTEGELLNAIIIPLAVLFVISLAICTCVLLRLFNKKEERIRITRLKEEREKEKMKEEMEKEARIENEKIKMTKFNNGSIRSNGNERMLKRKNGINNNGYEAETNNHKSVDVNDVYTTEQTAREANGETSRSNSTIINVKDESTSRPNSVSSSTRILSRTDVQPDVEQDATTSKDVTQSNGSLGGVDRNNEDKFDAPPNVDSS